MKEIDFYYIEKPQGSSEYMLFARYDTMPQTAYHGTKRLMDNIHTTLNVVLNKKYNEQGRPELIVKSSSPKN